MTVVSSFSFRTPVIAPASEKNYSWMSWLRWDRGCKMAEFTGFVGLKIGRKKSVLICSCPKIESTRTKQKRQSFMQKKLHVKVWAFGIN